ncbi:MAG: hypothetical protein RBS80_06875 [Thermoguttaceae bacterium]|jgi:cytoskeletal protein RodZ|nr:hypothetical protein [Thermoguttaceae bacterium]
MQYDKPEDLDWLAFCYIAGELPEAEADAFETRMADDQEAREAVARAVGLALMLAGTDPKGQHSRTVSQAASARRHARIPRRVAWVAVAAAACLAGVWAYQSFQGPADQAGPPEQLADDGEATISDSPSQQLALLWSRTREELAILLHDHLVSDSADNDEPFEEVAWFPTEDEADPDLLTDDDTLAVNDPPTWMLAAVRAGFGGAATGAYGPSNPQEN